MRVTEVLLKVPNALLQEGKSQRETIERSFVFPPWLVYIDTLFSAAAITVWVSQNNGFQSDISTAVCVCVFLVTIIYSSLPLRGVVWSALPVILLYCSGSIGSVILVNGASHNKLCDWPRPMLLTSVVRAYGEYTTKIRPAVALRPLMKAHKWIKTSSSLT